MKKAYDVIVFDLGNTLIRFDHAISAGKIAGAFGLDAKKIYDAFFDSSLTREFEKGLISPREFYAQAKALLGIEMPYKGFVEIWNDIFWLDDDSCALARRLKTEYRYKLYLLSNVNRLHFEHIQRRFGALLEIFDEVILSFLVGAIKPDKRIFEDVIARAGGDRRRLLYIDDREDLIVEATALGIDSIRYEGAAKLAETLAAKGVM